MQRLSEHLIRTEQRTKGLLQRVRSLKDRSETDAKLEALRRDIKQKEE